MKIILEEEDINITDQPNGKFSYKLKRLGADNIIVEDIPTKEKVVESAQLKLTEICKDILNPS